MFLDERRSGRHLLLSRVAPGTHAIQIDLAGWETWKALRQPKGDPRRKSSRT